MRHARSGRQVGTRSSRSHSIIRPQWGCITRLFAITCALCAATWVHAQTTNLYDADSRLIGVLNASGNTTRYVYDDIGNLVRTDSLPSSQLVILGFSPEHGAPGVPITVWGQGFSTTAASDALSFNGTAAVVTSATAHQLQATVPSGATTGPISVTVGGTTATSLNNFTVDDTGVAPTLTSVSPTIGAAGTVVTLTGTHLDPTPGATTVTLNSVPLVPTTLSDTSITFTTPAYLGSGRFVVTTPYGQASAGTDYTTIAPDFSSSSYVISTGRLVVGGPTVSVKATSSSGVTELLYDATAGSWLTLQASGLPTTNSAQVEIYDPRGLLIGPQNYLQSNTPSVPLLQMPETGTYTLVIWPEQKATFNVWLTSDPQLGANAPYAFATTVKGQSKRLMFNAPAGQSFGVGLYNMSVTQTDAEIQFTLLDGNGQPIINGECQPSEQTTCNVNDPAFAVNQGNAALPAPGWRQLILTSDQGTTSKATVVLTPDIVQPITVGNAATLQLQTVGQNGDQTFTGTAGQYLSLNLTSVSTTPSGNQVSFTVYDPTGAQIYNNDLSAGQIMNLPQLALSGTYTIYVVPYQGVTATVADTLLANSTAAATVNGAGVSVNATVSEENAYVTFQAQQGLSYTISGVCNSSDGYTNINVTDPSGNTVGAGGYCGSSSQSATVSNATAGTYTVTLQDEAPFTATVTVTQP